MNACSATTGRELRNLVDVEIDPDPGQMTGSTMGVHSMPADALIGVGRYATVVVDPELSWPRATAAVLSLSRQRRSGRTGQTSRCAIAVAPINSRRPTNGGASPRGGP